MKKHYTYIIYSKSHNIYYKGYSTRPYERLKEHNARLSRYTKDKGPWKLVFLQLFPTKQEALKREKSLKHVNKNYLLWIMLQPYNIIGQ